MLDIRTIYRKKKINKQFKIIFPYHLHNSMQAFNKTKCHGLKHLMNKGIFQFPINWLTE